MPTPKLMERIEFAACPAAARFKHEDEARGPAFAKEFSELMYST